MNKYANTYLDSISKAIGEYKPFNQLESVTNGLPVASIGGAGIGALIGGLSQAGDPGYDAKGNQKSRLKQVLKGVALGGATGGVVGGLGAAALPSIFQGGLETARVIANTGHNKNMKDGPGAEFMRFMNQNKTNAQAGVLSQIVPHMDVKTLTETVQQIREQQKANMP